MQAVIKRHIQVFGRMNADFQAWWKTQQQESVAPAIDLEQLMAQLPPQVRAMIEAQGGLDNPALAEIIASVTAAGSGAGADGNMMASLMPMIADFKALYSEFSDRKTELTAEDKVAAALKLRLLLKRYLDDPESIVSVAYRQVEQRYPEGVSSSKLTEMLHKVRSIVTLLGPKRSDPIWRLLDVAKSALHRVQKKTKNTSVTRETLPEKVEQLLLAVDRLTAEATAGSSMLELFQQSESLQAAVGLLSGTGMAMSQVNEDPFSAGPSSSERVAEMAEKMKAALSAMGIEIGEGGVMGMLGGGGLGGLAAMFGGGGSATPGGPDDEDSEPWSV